MLQLKDLWRRSVGEEVTTCDEKILEESEGLLGLSRLWVNGRAWLAGTLLSDRVQNLRPPRLWRAKEEGKEDRRSAQRRRGLHGECGLGLANTGENSTA